MAFDKAASLSPHNSILRNLRILWRYRQRVYEGVAQDVRQRYVGSMLGVAWVLIFPIVQLGIYAGLYTYIFRVRPMGLSELEYVVLVFSGLAPLMAFSEVLAASTSSLTANKSLLLNTVFPADLIPVRVALSAQVTSLVALVATLAAGFVFGRSSWLGIFLVPIFWVLLLMFAIGIGWIFSLVALVARDIQHALGLITMLLFVLSPFAYTPEMVPEALRPLIYLNPLSYFVLVFQQLICYGTWPDIVPAVGAVALGLGMFLLGFSVFQRVKYVFFDYA